MENTFPMPMAKVTSPGEIIARVPEPVVSIFGNQDTLIDSIAALDEAVPGSISFCSLRGTKAYSAIQASNASMIIAHAEIAVDDILFVNKRCLVLVKDPMRWFIYALKGLVSEKRPTGIDTTASISVSAKIGKGVSIGAYALIGSDVVIGDHTEIDSHVVLQPGVRVGRNSFVGSHSVIGGDGLAVAWSEDGFAVPFPHYGKVVIGNHVRIGAQACIVRGILKDTVICDGCQIGNQVNIGHNSFIGRNSWISSQVVLCGSTTIEERVMVGAKATIKNHVTLGTGSFVGLGAVVTKSVSSGKNVFGVPAKEIPTMKKL